MLNGKEKVSIYLPDVKGNYFGGKTKTAYEAAFVQAWESCLIHYLLPEVCSVLAKLKSCEWGFIKCLSSPHSFHTSEISQIGFNLWSSEPRIIAKWRRIGRNTPWNLEGSKVVFLDMPVNACLLPSSSMNTYRLLCLKGNRKQYKESVKWTTEGMFSSKMWTEKSENPENFTPSFHQTLFFYLLYRQAGRDNTF